MENMIIRVDGLRRDIERGLPDAARLLDDFNEEQKQRVKYIKEVTLVILLNPKPA